MSFNSNSSSKSHQSIYILLKVVVQNALHNRNDRACLLGGGIISIQVIAAWKSSQMQHESIKAGQTVSSHSFAVQLRAVRTQIHTTETRERSTYSLKVLDCELSIFQHTQHFRNNKTFRVGCNHEQLLHIIACLSASEIVCQFKCNLGTSTSQK